MKIAKVKKIIDEIKEKGYVVIPNFYSSEDCSELRGEIDKLLLKCDKNGSLWTDEWEADKRCFVAEEYSQLIAKFHNDSFLESVADNYFQGKMLVSNTLASKIEYVEGNIGSGQGWHRDGNNFQFKAILYLSDVELNDGPFQIIEGSHKFTSVLRDTKIMGSEADNTRFSNEQIEKLKIKYPDKYKVFTASEGTLIFADVSSIHTGMSLGEGGSRYSLFNYYYPSYDDIKKRKETFRNAGKTKEYI